MLKKVMFYSCVCAKQIYIAYKKDDFFLTNIDIQSIKILAQKESIIKKLKLEEKLSMQDLILYYRTYKFLVADKEDAEENLLSSLDESIKDTGESVEIWLKSGITIRAIQLFFIARIFLSQQHGYLSNFARIVSDFTECEKKANFIKENTEVLFDFQSSRGKMILNCNDVINELKNSTEQQETINMLLQIFKEKQNEKNWNKCRAKFKNKIIQAGDEKYKIKDLFFQEKKITYSKIKMIVINSVLHNEICDFVYSLPRDSNSLTIELRNKYGKLVCYFQEKIIANDSTSKEDNNILQALDHRRGNVYCAQGENAETTFVLILDYKFIGNKNYTATTPTPEQVKKLIYFVANKLCFT